MILPLLQEYFYNDWEKIRLILNDHRKEKQLQFIHVAGGNPGDGKLQQELFGNNSNIVEYEERRIYRINNDAFNNPESYIKIYS